MVLDELEFIIFVSQGLTLSTASLVLTLHWLRSMSLCTPVVDLPSPQTESLVQILKSNEKEQVEVEVIQAGSKG